MVGGCEVESSIEFFADFLVSSELLAVVGSKGQHVRLDGLEAFDDALAGGIGGWPFQQYELGELAFALDDAGDGAHVFSADDAVEFPVAQAGLGIDDLWALLNAHATGNHTSACVLTAALVALLALLAKVLVERSTGAFIAPDV